MWGCCARDADPWAAARAAAVASIDADLAVDVWESWVDHNQDPCKLKAALAYIEREARASLEPQHQRPLTRVELGVARGVASARADSASEVVPAWAELAAARGL